MKTPTKKLIICEGSNDGLFIESILSNLGLSKRQYIFFDQQQLSALDRKYGERNELFRFSQENSKEEVLVKLEGGNHAAVKILIDSIDYCINNTKNVIFVLDLDGGKLADKKSHIEKLIKERLRNPSLLLEFSKERELEHFYYLTSTIRSSKPSCKMIDVHLLLFKRDLECACGLTDDQLKKKEVVREKIERLGREGKVMELFKGLL
jgi:hypothetical protein